MRGYTHVLTAVTLAKIRSTLNTVDGVDPKGRSAHYGGETFREHNHDSLVVKPVA
jgi:hypothetical protein